MSLADDFDPQKVADLVAAIRQQLFELTVRMALLTPAMGNGHGPGPGDGRVVLTVRADSEAVIEALERNLTVGELRRIRWVVRG